MSTALACSGMTVLFFGEEEDNAHRLEKMNREKKARHICLEFCDKRMQCLERSLVLNESEGVWGGMSELERRHFRTYLRKQGWIREDNLLEIPEGDDFWDALYGFYKTQERKQLCRL